MKGQFFVIGVLLLASLILGVSVIWGDIKISSPGPALPSSIVEKRVEEFPKAINAILYETENIKQIKRKIRRYIEFNTLSYNTHGSNARFYVLVGIPKQNNLSIIAGNFYGNDLNGLEIWMNGDMKRINVKDNYLENVTFESAPHNVTIRFNFTGANITFNTYKRVFSYIEAEIRSEGSVIKKKLIG